MSPQRTRDIQLKSKHLDNEGGKIPGVWLEDYEKKEKSHDNYRKNFLQIFPEHLAFSPLFSFFPSFSFKETFSKSNNIYIFEILRKYSRE